MDNWFNTTNEWIIYALTVLLLMGAVECGVLLANYHRARDPDEDANHFVSSLAAPSIGLLALMIGFTFAMSLSRFEARKAAVLDEANAIGTAALRGRMLPEPSSAAVAPLFKEYAQLRVVHRGLRFGSVQSAEQLRRSAELQERLWQVAMAAAKSNPNVVPTGLFIQALNSMIDMHETRLTANRNNVPVVVFLMLEGIAVVALGFSGYGAAQARMHHRLAMLLMALMIGSVITLIFDLDRPQSGIITVSQQPLLDVIQGMP
jgi:hypothetical protein